MTRVHDWLDLLHEVMGWDWMNLILLLGMAVLTSLLCYAQFVRNDGFDLRHLMANKVNGKWIVDSKKTRLTVAFIVMTWGFVWLILHDKFSEWYFVGYGGMWVADQMLTRWSNPSMMPPSKPADPKE